MHIRIPRPSDPDSINRLKEDLSALNRKAVLLLGVVYGRDVNPIVSCATPKARELGTPEQVLLEVSVSMPRQGWCVATYYFHADTDGSCAITDYFVLGEEEAKRTDPAQHRMLSWPEAARDIVKSTSFFLLEAVNAPQRMRELVDQLVCE
jgi:hypothetical protein